MLYIEENLLMAILAGAREAYPREFFSLLGGRRAGQDVFLDHFVWVPGRAGRTSVIFNLWHIPYRSLASVHSHPFPSPPSTSDLRTFPFIGDYHIIVQFPFRKTDVLAFDARGKEVPWVVWVREPGT